MKRVSKKRQTLSVWALPEMKVYSVAAENYFCLIINSFQL